MIIFSIIGVVIAYIIISEVIKGKSRVHHGRAQRSVRELINVSQDLRPSWFHDNEKQKNFAILFESLLNKKCIPQDFRQHIYSDKDGATMIANFLALMEQKGASFNEQIVAAADMIADTWEFQKSKIT